MSLQPELALAGSKVDLRFSVYSMSDLVQGEAAVILSVLSFPYWNTAACMCQLAGLQQKDGYICLWPAGD